MCGYNDPEREERKVHGRDVVKSIENRMHLMRKVNQPVSPIN